MRQLVQDAPTRESPLRNQAIPTIPVDSETRLQLIRTELDPQLDFEPIWTAPLRRKLDQIVAEHRRSETLRRSGLSPTRTALFTGMPGVGKTLAARWLANQLRLPLLTIDLSAVMSSFLGRTGTNVRHALDYAKSTRCVLLIDEIDSMAKRRDDLQEVGELKRLVNVLLQEIDDWPEGNLLVAATNHPELLDPAVWRRFEMQVEFPLPSGDAVHRAVNLTLRHHPEIGSNWIASLAEVFVGQSFSDIERELTIARREALLHDEPLERIIVDVIRRHIEDLPKSVKKDIAVRLAAAGLSQRQLNDLTGLSRDTIRKIAPADAGAGA
jgi:SpoVK/Ycf46/Vps4 family AAA+-type ATPase